MTRSAVSFGEALIDCYPDHREVAGAPLHVAAHLARAGWQSRLLTRLGDDADGRRIRTLLDSYGVLADLVETDPSHPTGTVTITFHGTDHTFEIHRPAAWDFIAGPGQLPPCDAFSFGSLASRTDTSWRTLCRLLEGSDAPHVVFDVNLRPPDIREEVLRFGLERATILKLNEDELVELARRLDLPRSPDGWCDRLPHLRFLCVTRGPDGAQLLARDGGSWSIGPAVPDQPESTVGAGDAFTSGLILGLVEGGPPERALSRARDLAAEVLRAPGGLPA